jgi:hypothetical protein
MSFKSRAILAGITAMIAAVILTFGALALSRHVTVALSKFSFPLCKADAATAGTLCVTDPARLLVPIKIAQ